MNHSEFNLTTLALIITVLQILAGTSNICGGICNKIQMLIKTYGFKSASPKDTNKVQANQWLYNHLKEDQNFLFVKTYLDVHNNYHQYPPPFNHSFLCVTRVSVHAHIHINMSLCQRCYTVSFSSAPVHWG